MSMLKAQSYVNKPQRKKTGLRGKLYYPCRREIVLSLYSENKGADHCEADLRLCFRIGKNPVFRKIITRYRRIGYNLNVICDSLHA